jgi:hypothetical protein
MAMTNEMAAPRRTLPPGYIHLGVAKEIAPILRSFGLDPDPVIREAGLDPLLFDDGTNVIPHAALGRLLTLCLARILGSWSVSVPRSCPSAWWGA